MSNERKRSTFVADTVAVKRRIKAQNYVCKSAQNLNPSKSSKALAADGVFHQSAEGFTPRVAQQEMAAAVEDALGHGGALVVESGTGTGKTYAYLVPVVLSGRRTIISTGTKHLQDQIFNRDLPQVGKVLGKPVDAALLKGRANYVCRYRLKLQTGQSDLIGKAETESFRLVEQWAATTQSGDISEATDLSEESPLWQRVTSTADNCLGGQCPDFKQCFVVKARQQAMQADIVVVNHHLFFSDFTLKSEGFGELLPQHDAVIFDEAHSLAETASVFFGFTISGGQIVDLERDVEAAEKAEQSGVDFSAASGLLKESLKDAQQASKRFIGQSVDFAALQNSEFNDACQGLRQALEGLTQALAAAAPSGDGLRRCHERCLLIQERLDTWLSGGDSNLICWAEIGERRFLFHGTPLQISDRFTEMMERKSAEWPAAWIFTSATLAVRKDFSAFCNRLGLQDAHTRRWESPYDFEKNALLYLPTDMPDPRQIGFDEALGNLITEVLNASRGRAFCLFTSYEMMNRVHRRLCDHADWGDWPVLLQGQAPKSELLKRFDEHGHAVLFGTSSFWEGVDVVGEHLSCVIIDKLPFAPPDDPVLKSRLNACEQEDGNPFMDIQVPQAVIALKQGAGRLIRSETDRGVLVLCDPRVVSKGYGRLFLGSLPGMARSRDINDVRAFFGAEPLESQ